MVEFTLDQLNKCIETAGLTIVLTSESQVKSFADLGLDSLDVFSLLSEVENLSGASIDDEAISDLTSPIKLIEFINSQST